MAYRAYKTHIENQRCPIFDEFIRLIEKKGFDISATPPPPPPKTEKHRGYKKTTQSPASEMVQTHLPADALQTTGANVLPPLAF